MKKIVMMVVAAIMATMNVQAQSDFSRHEVAVSYGELSNSEWIDILEQITITMVTGAKYGKEKFTGAFSAEYFYHPKEWLAIGGIFVYGRSRQEVYFLSDNIGDYTNRYYTLMPALKFDWLRTKYFGMYSKVAFGATLRTEHFDDKNESKVHFNWQASGIGIEAGAPHVRAFAELGVGEQGIILGGIRCKF